MLRRIQKIINIGRFANNISGGCQFEKETIIFGFNTQGKSTLTAILRSLQTGNSDTLIGRKTFGATGAKNIEIDFENAGVVDKHNFKSRAWNKINPDILIFDSKFIAENVFDGEKITFDQQKNLNTIIIGKAGQDLNDEIITLQKQGDELSTRKGEKTREFSRHFLGCDFAHFKSLGKDAKIDQKILDKEKEIQFEKDKEAIKTSVGLHIKNLSSIKFSVRDTFIKTLDIKQDEIDAHIKTHFSKEEGAQSFLKEGVGFLKDKLTEESLRSCVFCGQEMRQEAESLVAVYSAFFKGGYATLQSEMDEAVTEFKNLNLEAMLERISADLKVKGLDVGLDATKITELTGLKTEFEKELEKKRDLNYVINLEPFDKLKTGVEIVKTNLEELEKAKLTTPSLKTISSLESEKKELDLIKKRHEPLWEKFCTEVDKMDSETEKIRLLREGKRKDLETHSLEVFNTHKGTINILCKDMGADFEIADFTPLRKLIGKDERIFAIKFFGSHKVNIDGTDDKTPNFRNTLSESDKRLLAFAFFISLLIHDRKLDNKIVVFDDPMSSLDSERRRKTMHCIADIQCKYKEDNGTEKVLVPKQKIILTHEDRFAKGLERLMPSACTLKIEEYMDIGEKRSKLVHADFSKDFPDDDISFRIEKIKGILDTRTLTVPFEEDCRIVLEHIFKRKYYLELKTEIATRKSVRTFTTTLTQNKIGGFDEDTKSKKFIRLCEDLNIELHEGASSTSNGDKESVLRDFFDCLKMI